MLSFVSRIAVSNFGIYASIVEFVSSHSSAVEIPLLVAHLMLYVGSHERLERLLLGSCTMVPGVEL